MTQVTPPPFARIPKGINRDLEQYFITQNRILLQLWERTGGNSDSINEYDIGFSDSTLDSEPNYEVRTISSDHTTSGNEFLRVTTACTITLNTIPDDGERVSIQPNGNFTVTISGTINGDNELIMRGAYDLADLVFSAELNEWVIT